MDNYVRCRGCSKKIPRIEMVNYMRQDAYGIPTGVYCDKCYDSDKYPYRRDRYYDKSYAGEELEPEPEIGGDTV